MTMIEQIESAMKRGFVVYWSGWVDGKFVVKFRKS